ncbi:MAG: protein kinase, partial [Polyangiaceae bacterium]
MNLRAYALDECYRRVETQAPAEVQHAGGAMASAQAIGPYRILEPLGHGGMGVVYRARRVGSDRAVALKTVRVPAPQWLHSIRREVDALTRIRHPGVVRIVDHGVDGGLPWYAMDLLEGESLRHFGRRIWSPYKAAPSTRLDAGELASATDELSFSESGEAVRPSFDEDSAVEVDASTGAPPVAAGELRRVLQLVRRICATLGFLHGEGFVNCDLKPENVLLVDGQPVIIDFGLTAHHPGGSGREALETQRSVSGTLPYMSPEQIRGEFVDARSDLYSVGCILYELVAGRTPFVGTPRSILWQHLSAEPTRPSELVTDLPSELESLLLKLLAKSLTARFGFADEVATLLARMSSDVVRLPDFPPARPYLYRPRFVGRSDLLGRLASLRDRALTGSGAFALVGGESGAGKTRLAMELTRVQPSSQFCVVTGEASGLAMDGAGLGAASAPLQAVRPLLQAVADRCQQGDHDLAERLLGSSRAVLAPYEPALAHIPLAEHEDLPHPLSIDASRRRLFACLSEVLAAFAREQPVLWVLDDLGWADELSLDFLKSLSARFLSSTPVFILGTYRLEEAVDGLTSLAQQPHVMHVRLPPLAHDAVASMI